MTKKPKKKTKSAEKSRAFDQSQPKRGGPPIVSSPLIEVRDSDVHGRGVFAVADIRKGTRIIEYLGDRVSHKAADARYEDHDENDNHTFLFIVDRNTVIDAAVGGNAARFINHHCDGNCASVIVHRRVFIDATRAIAPGEELGYDYEIGRDKEDPPNVDEIYACRCGSPKCRGSMLEAAPKKAGDKKPGGKKTASRRKPVKTRKSRRPEAKRRGERPRRRA
jgi:SET domain-containing protein